MAASPTTIVDFWRAAGPRSWFRKDEAFDRSFGERFLGLHEEAAQGGLDGWRQTAEGCLALAILLDQFPRNVFRGSPRMYETDPQAREVARVAVAQGFDLQVEEQLRNFLYLPFMHSEDVEDQRRCVELTRPLGGESHRFARHHLEIVERFGRFPHRNAVLGRDSTPEEKEFLAEGGFAG